MLRNRKVLYLNITSILTDMCILMKIYDLKYTLIPRTQTIGKLKSFCYPFKVLYGHTT